jgi:NTP pyrophosphatase (non-canonical NTP hydrolase)
MKTTSSLRDYQRFVDQVYGPSNERHFSVDEMLTNISRFAMRGLKGIRKNDPEKIKLNITIALSWFTSLMNQLDIDLEDSVWHRFPYLCSYCGECPCACKKKKIQKRVKIKIDSSLKPKTIHDLQAMFDNIYPAGGRTLEHAGIHLAEEIGELSEAVLKFRGHHSDTDMAQVVLEASDLFSCFMGVFNSLDFDYSKYLASQFSDGCHVCKKTPCVCEYDAVVNFKS